MIEGQSRYACFGTGVKTVEDKAEFSSGGRSNRLIGYLIAIAVVFAVLFGLRALIDLYREAEKKNKKVEDLKLTSVDGEVTITLPFCVYEGEAFKSGEYFPRTQYRYAACDSENEFYEKVVFASPYYRWTVAERHGEVLPARAKSIPKEGGYVYFLKDNRYFLLEFRQNSRSGYSKYYLELSETLLDVNAGEDGTGYFAFPAEYPSVHNRSLDRAKTHEYRYDRMLGFGCYEELAQFYGAMDESQRFLDEAGRTIYVRLFGNTDGVKETVAQIVCGEDAVRISFVSVADVQAEFENAFSE